MTDFKHFERPTTEKPGTLLSATIISAFVGLVTGAAGFTLMKNIYPQDVIFVNGNGSGTIRLDLNDSLAKVALAYSDHIGSVYNRLPESIIATDNIHTDKEFVGNVVAVTSDGWFLGGPSLNVPAFENFELYIAGKSYPIKELRKDEKFDLLFLKIEANNFKPVNFSSLSELSTGSTLIYNILKVGNQPFFGHTVINQSLYLDTQTKGSQINFSDSFFDKMLVADPKLPKGHPLFLTNGHLAGITIGDSALLPAVYLQASVSSMLSGEEPAELGVYYIELYRLAKEGQKGVQLYNLSRNAIIKGSAADRAGLKEGDVILALDNQEINSQNSLGTLLLNYRAGDKAIFKVTRQTEALDIEVIF